jgi:hypothetical protein
VIPEYHGSLSAVRAEGEESGIGRRFLFEERECTSAGLDPRAAHEFDLGIERMTRSLARHGRHFALQLRDVSHKVLAEPARVDANRNGDDYR